MNRRVVPNDPSRARTIVTGLATISIALLTCIRVASAQETVMTLAVPDKAQVTWRAARLPLESIEWSNVRSLAEDNSGHVFVLDAAAKSVRHFDTSGRLVRTYGREGSGPGEFRSPGWIFLMMDTLFVEDPQNGRLTAFSTRSGRIVQHNRVRSVEGPLALSLNGTISMRVAPASAGAEPRVTYLHTERDAREARPIISYPRVGQHTLSFALYRSDTQGRLTNRRIGIANARHPFSTHPLVASSPDGSGLIVVVREPTSAASALSFLRRSRSPSSVEIRRIALNGRTVDSLRLRVERRELSTEDRKALVDSFANPTFRVSGTRPLADPREVNDSLGPSASWPAVVDVIAGKDGSIWLQQPPARGAGQRFWRLSASGQALAPIELPRGFTALAVSTNYAWGILESSASVIEVVRAGVPSRPGRR